MRMLALALVGLAAAESGTVLGKEFQHTPSIRAWASLSEAEKAQATPPYVPPKDRKYNTKAGPVPGKVNVHLVPHSHDDTGWQVTVDQYFLKEVYFIVDTVVASLLEDPNRRFMFAEIGFFARWWEESTDEKREQARHLVTEGRLEFVNGGWCMHDEASPHFVEMVDQTTRGHLFILKNFGKCGNPTATWQIDPFGHSSTSAWLIGAESGMQSLFWGRMDYQDFRARFNESRLEWVWQASQSLGDSAQLFAGELFGTGGGGYSTWLNFDGETEGVMDDPMLFEYNVDKLVDQFVQNALFQAAHTRTEHQIWACGGDFQFQNADHWYRALDKLIHYVNQNGTVNAMYSTPSFYTAQKYKAGIAWEVRQDDIFPLADDAHHYWSGYFTSRPALKRHVHVASAWLQAARQLEVFSGVTAAEVPKVEQHFSPPVGDSWTDSLEGFIGVATHHDAMSGTERQDVSNDYSLRIAQGHKDAERGAGLALQRLGALKGSAEHCNCLSPQTCLNISSCAATSARTAKGQSFGLAAWNANAQPYAQPARVPVVGPNWRVVGPSGPVPSQVAALDARTESLPKLYLNSYGLNASQAKAAEQALANPATHELTFLLEAPSVGFAAYTVEPASVAAAGPEPAGPAPVVVSNGELELTFDGATQSPSQLKNLKTGKTTPFKVEAGWYNSSVGGCTPDVPASLACDSQKSGAYIFRPNTSSLLYPGPNETPRLEVVRGDLVTEVKQHVSDWVTFVFRLVKGQPYVEVEWTVGPIPTNTPWVGKTGTDWGKEVVVRYSTGLASGGKFETDANGREMQPRITNGRGPSYPKLVVNEPVAGNYYPVNTMISVEEPSAQFCVLTDVVQGGASLADGQVELMVHRRVLEDDSRGVQEPLNETMCGCNDINAPWGQMGEYGHEADGGCWCEGLTMRGRHWLLLDTPETVNAQRRQLSEALHFPPLLAFADAAAPKQQSFGALPANVKLVTLTNNYQQLHGGKLLARFAHLYSVGEHPTLSKPVTFDLAHVFPGYSITAVEEMSLTANQARAAMEAQKYHWKTTDLTGGVVDAKYASAEAHIPVVGTAVTLRPMEVKTFLFDMHPSGEPVTDSAQRVFV